MADRRDRSVSGLATNRALGELPQTYVAAVALRVGRKFNLRRIFNLAPGGAW